MENKHWRYPPGGVITVFLLATLYTITVSKPDPEAYHELDEEEYDIFLQELHQPHIPHYDVNLARLKRQAGELTYEYDSDEEESGPWDEWGPPSSCSRTCGGGVITEERSCTAPKPDSCVGPSKRFSSCNIDECPPGSKDFREEQCSKFNNELFERKYYDWIPYLKAPRKCELNCMPKGERFYYRHAKKVIDGTSCDDEGRRICVDGECMPVGCDGMLGSNTEEDKCRICGGDGSTCETVTGVLDEQDLQMGYNDLAVIPPGATNIRIAEMKASNNYLALRNSTGHYYLNGNWRIDYPQQMDICGTTFHYERKYKNTKARGPLTLFAPESIRALGPTTESLYIVILYQETNPGIEFEYSLKKDAVKETPVGTSGGYSWTQASWGECNAPCGGGTRVREVFCSAVDTFERVDDGLCDPYLKPPENETCNASPCKPRWNVGEWGNCTEGNGTDCTQFQFRNVFCEQTLANNVPSLVDDEQCSELGDPPVSVKSCDEEIEDDFMVEDETTPKYHTGPWTGCSVICGDGIKTRDVTCYKKTEEGDIEILEDSECMGNKPAIEEPCTNETPCEPADWIISDFTECDGTCGLTHTSRHALCTDGEGNALPDEEIDRCDQDQTPPLVEECEESTPVCEFSWYATQWSDCSSKCSDVMGVQSRHVFCGSMTEDGTISNTTEDNCKEELKYDITKECNGTEECTGNWYASSFGSCSEDCGPGKMNRRVFCIKDGEPVSPTECPEDKKPMEETDCDNLCEDASGDGSGNGTATDTGECEYYDDWWIFGKDGDNGSGEGSEEGSGEGEGETVRRKREADEASGSGDESSGDTEESSDDGSSNSGDGSGDEAISETSGNSTKKEIDLSIFSRRCKPEKIEPCGNSTYGCCPDGFFAAEGPFDEGCMEYKTCEDTRYGCCRDGFTTAEGPNFKNCPTNVCETTLFGCCDDGETAASGVGEESNCEENKKCQSGKFGCCPDGRTFSQGPKKQGCFECPEEVFICDECEKTEFGCCPDLQNAAAGPEFEGCPDEDGEIYEDCTLTEYGCCPDGITRAKGLNFKGCDNATPCKDAKWGCCDDLMNPAHGPNKEGCCLNTEFGCCPDNTIAAEGPDNKGCGCEFTEFGCCPDDMTPARGEGFAGCGCVSTENGCCPDKFTPSPGPDQQGCPCNTFEYGCCPDGESIARGPGQEGCTCKDREFGCCPDRRTPASGIDLEGCGCAASLYGCCPDGNSTAEGENFMGCGDQELPEAPPEVCGMEKDRGPARNFTVRWSFDMEYGGCSRFWYGGEGGNRNNFMTKEECNEICVDPVGKAACNLPIVPGPCEGYYPRYGYNPETGVCSQFTYGGCLGNNNKFKTQEECDDTCVENEFKLKLTNKCEQDIEPGPCAGNFTRWGYNKDTEQCEEFNYGGCKGNLNSFLTETECENSCKDGGGSRAMCLLPRAPGPCQDRIPKWYFDNFEKRCMPFYYGGCEGNGNKFDSEEECQQSCPSEFLQADICKIEKEVGPCRDLVERYYFDSQMGTCQKFYFGGCEGNKNNFLTLEDCQGRCSMDYSIPIEEEFKLEFCFEGKDPGDGNEKIQRWYYDHEDGVCKDFLYGGKKGNRNRFLTRQNCESSCFEAQDICELPKVVGPCNGNMEQYWYDKSKDECFTFNYGGCQGNGNKFDTQEFCENRCKKGTGPRRPLSPIALGVDICNLPMKEGPCTENKPAWFFDASTGQCSAFTYGGCEGNANRYESEEQCQRQCGKFKNQDVCSFERDFGPCLGRFKKFYYNQNLKVCEQFTYGGCEGNGNRFSSITECEMICLTREEPEVPQQSTLSKKDICALEVDTGLNTCDDQLKRWYYNEASETCTAFIYSGCAGNQNRFKTFDVCMGFCEAISPSQKSPYRPQDTYRPPPDNYRPPNQDHNQPATETPIDKSQPYDPTACAASEERCQYARCKYGTQRYFDDRTQCEECYCNEPCQGFECPDGTSCQVEPYTARGETIYKAVCKDDTKDGICPKVNRNEYAKCDEECSSDGDCSGKQKCCYNGCGKSCMQAAEDPGMVDYEDDSVTPVNPNAPVIEVVDTPIFVPEGDIANLKVNVRGTPTPDVYWRKGRTTINPLTGRFRILPGGTLQIVGVRREDEGTYDCFADNGLGPPVSKQLILSVDEPKDLAAQIVETDPDIVMSLGSPATLYCLAFGFPKPTVTWWKDTQMLPLASERVSQGDDYTLKLSSIALSDLGPYTCQAYNGLGEAASFNVHMKAYGPVNPGPGEQQFMRHVINPPSAPVRTTTERPGVYRPTRPTGWDYERPPPVTTIRPRLRDITVRIGLAQTRFPLNSNIRVPCDVNSGIKPTKTWMKNNYPLEQTSRVRILPNNTLAIDRAQADDSGNYLCRASNGYKEAEDSVNLTVEDLQVQEDCVDNPYFANCKLIVKARYCGNKYYAKFCCRSCTIAGQLPFGQGRR